MSLESPVHVLPLAVSMETTANSVSLMMPREFNVKYITADHRTPWGLNPSRSPPNQLSNLSITLRHSGFAVLWAVLFVTIWALPGSSLTETK